MLKLWVAKTPEARTEWKDGEKIRRTALYCHGSQACHSLTGFQGTGAALHVLPAGALLHTNTCTRAVIELTAW